MSLGLDLGTSGFRSLWKHDGELIGRQTPTDYIVLPHDPSHIQLLERANIAFRTAESSLIVTADAAGELSRVLGQPLVPLLPDAALPAQDPIARQIAAGLVEGLLPAADGRGQSCALVVPGDDDGSLGTGCDFFVRLLRLANYRPVTLAASHALALAELGRHRLTGLALTFGAGTVGLCLMELGSPRITVTTRTGGDQIDREIAESLQLFVWDADGNRYLNTAGIRQWKEESQRSLIEPREDVEHALASRMAAALDETLIAFGNALRSAPELAARDYRLPIVCHGGGTCAVGFRELLLQRWTAAELPITPASVRIVGRDPWTITRGCLIHNEVETLGRPQREVA